MSFLRNLFRYEPIEGTSDDFSFASIATEVGVPIGWFSKEGDQTMLYGHLAYTDFLDEIEFNNNVEEFDSVASVWQVGFAIGRRENPVRLWLFSFDRLGLAFKYSAQSELRGVRFIFRSIYDL